MARKWLEFITGILLILVTGLFWGTWFSLSRTMDGLPPEIFITIGNEIIKNVAWPMRIIMPASIAGLIILLIASWKRKGFYFYCILTSLILFVISLVITVAVEVPMDNQIKTWQVATLPADWAHIRDRWEYYHTIRTFTSLAGISFFLTGLIQRNK